MKKVLIVGANSYIGESFAKYAEDYFQIDTVGTLADEWKNFDFSSYQSILHVAGIAHVSLKKEMKPLYYKVNRDLAIEVAKKAKADGVRQFVFMSSMIVYGNDAKIGEQLFITLDTVPNPANFYGESKLEAEQGLNLFADEKFKVLNVRNPMVYGKGCKGNFPKLIKLARVLPIFPTIDNIRSMIYIENLCEYIRQAIETERFGVAFPQNIEYSSTQRIIQQAANQFQRNVKFVNFLNPIIRLMSLKIAYINKIFGNKAYVFSGEENSYNVVTFKDSITKSM